MIANFPLIIVVAGTIRPNREGIGRLGQGASRQGELRDLARLHITTELLKLKSGMPGVMIPYKSSNEMILAVIDGQTLITIPTVRRRSHRSSR